MTPARALTLVVTATAALALTATGAPQVRAAADPVDVQLVAVADFHGQLEPGSEMTGATPGELRDADGTIFPAGGASYLATHLQQIRDGHENSIFFSAGDNFSGWRQAVTAHNDEPTIEVLNTLGLEFSAVGNHELDISLDHLRTTIVNGQCSGVIGVDSCFEDSRGQRYHGADFDYYAGNMVSTGTGSQLMPGTVVKSVTDADGREHEVGFINVNVPRREDDQDPIMSYQPDILITPIVASVNQQAAALKAEGVKAIVANIHDGAVQEIGGYNECSDVTGYLRELVGDISADVDAIVGAHRHHAFNCMLPDPDGRLRPFVEPSSNGRAIAEINLQLDAATGEVIRDKTVSTNHAVTRDVAPDPEMQRIVDYWVDKVPDTLSKPVAEITEDVTTESDTSGESALGNLIADSYVTASEQGSRADFALAPTLPGADFGADLTVDDETTPGVITVDEAWQSVGDHTGLVSVLIRGSQLREILEQQWRFDDQGQPVTDLLAGSAALNYSYDPTQPVGSRIDPAAITIDGKRMQPDKKYRVATTVNMMFGRTGFTKFSTYTQPERLTWTRNAFRTHLREIATVSAPKTDRVDVVTAP